MVSKLYSTPIWALKERRVAKETENAVYRVSTLYVGGN